MGDRPPNLPLTLLPKFENGDVVSFPPFLYECFLFATTNEKDSVAQVGKGVINFKLRKVEPGFWNQLQINETDNKDITKEIRNQSLLSFQKRMETLQTEASETKRKNEKYALNEMMKLENEEKTRIENVKQSEREKAMKELDEWKQQQLQSALLMKNQKIQENKEKYRKEKDDIFQSPKEARTNGSVNMENGGAATREAGTIEVSFTPRVFPTPVRESVTPQEEEWLKKQAEMKNICESLDKDLTDEERNPVWLKDKGNAFFKSGDLHSAINAYTQAIRLNSNLPAFSNRAACHMKLGNYMKCIEDCSKALDHLTPPVPQNKMSRCKALIRRGTAFCQLELYVEGLQEYEAAIKLDAGNEELKQDAARIREVIEGTSTLTV